MLRDEVWLDLHNNCWCVQSFRPYCCVVRQIPSLKHHLLAPSIIPRNSNRKHFSLPFWTWKLFWILHPLCLCWKSLALLCLAAAQAAPPLWPAAKPFVCVTVNRKCLRKVRLQVNVDAPVCFLCEYMWLMEARRVPRTVHSNQTPSFWVQLRVCSCNHPISFFKMC